VASYHEILAGGLPAEFASFSRAADIFGSEKFFPGKSFDSDRNSADTAILWGGSTNDHRIQ